jgi:predicted ester cyclase
VHPLAALLRRYAYAYTAAGDLSVARELMTPDYTLTMGTHVLRGRDQAYLPAVARQFRQFPTLGFTVHALVLGEDRAALRFTEHGRSTRTGTLAAWTGVSLYTWDGSRLTSCRVEQDYASRRHQLTTGTCDPVRPPAPDPWSVAPSPPDPAAEHTVRGWLADVEILDLFSAGPHVAFHTRRATRHTTGIAHVTDKTVHRITTHHPPQRS